MNACEMLPNCSPIVENIFKYLSARDLSSCAQVCKMWNSMAETENKRRLFMEGFLQQSCFGCHGGSEDYLAMSLPNEKYSFQDGLLDSKLKAATLICFLTKHLLKKPEFTFKFKQESPPAKRTKIGSCEKRRHLLMATADHYLKPCLPAQCRIFCMSSRGIIGSQGNKTPREVEFGDAITGILIPHFPGVEIHHVAIDAKAAPEFPKVPIKCLLMFVGPFPERIQPLVNHCIENQNETFALGGALVDGSMASLGSCFAFTGENVEAASIIIDESVEEISAELKSFEQTGLLSNQCVCFAFACVEKGCYLYGSENYESDLFHKIYPNVPLIGLFGYGEIGAYHVPNVEGEVHLQKTKRFGYEKCLRSHSTVFVLVSMKKTT